MSETPRCPCRTCYFSDLWFLERWERPSSWSSTNKRYCPSCGAELHDDGTHGLSHQQFEQRVAELEAEREEILALAKTMGADLARCQAHDDYNPPQTMGEEVMQQQPEANDDE